MHYLLNIGLNIPGTDKTLPVATALAVVRELLSPADRIISGHTRQSDTEPTLVLFIDGFPPYSDDMRTLAERLLQDCIAYCKADANARPLLSTGELFGPKAADWGPFNPVYFILPDGRRAA